MKDAPLWARLAAQVVPRLPGGRYRAAAWLGRRLPGPCWMPFPPSHGVLEFVCDPGDHLARDVAFAGVYEPQETCLVQAILRPGMAFVDVGANWGYFTLLGAHQVGRSGRILSLEPDPRLFDLLKKNLVRNSATHVEALARAATDRTQWVSLHGFAEGDDNRGTSRILEGSSRGGQRFQVEGSPLDSLIPEFLGKTPIDLMKMDIEGAEGLALSGAALSLQSGQIRRLLLELHPEPLQEMGQSADDILRDLQHFGYTGWVVDHTPRMNRRASYRRQLRPGEILRRYQSDQPLDSWPHMLWLAKGIPEPL